ncbi:MAG: DUF1800 domain-containing protein [Candidatus Limnocylindrales bacterium]
MVTDRALIAHLLRRVSFGPLPGQVDALAPGGIAAAIETVLSAPPLPIGPAPDLSPLPNRAPIGWWLARMGDPNAGLTEKLTWFWHGHLTSSQAKVRDWGAMWRQHQLLAADALGDFRALVQSVTTDPAMLRYLDGSGSEAAAPNENYGRELMELFTLGRGNYTQADVHAAAMALSGWQLDPRAPGGSRFVASRGLAAPVTLLGRQVMTAADVVNTVCDQPACPPFVAGELFAYLMGTDPTPAQRQQYGDLFQAVGLRVRPLVEGILQDPAFLLARQTRPRYPVEWLTAAMGALGLQQPSLAAQLCVRMGQVPFFPPNVAGWPVGLRWLAPSFALVRAALGARAVGIAEVAGAADPVAATLHRCSIEEVTPATQQALETSATALSDPHERAAILLGLAVGSPEFALA